MMIMLVLLWVRCHYSNLEYERNSDMLLLLLVGGWQTIGNNQ